MTLRQGTLGYNILAERKNTLFALGGDPHWMMARFADEFPTFDIASDPTGAFDILDQGNQGACFPAGTKITLANGELKPVEQIVYGDTVLSHLGRARQVVDVMSRPFSGELYRVFIKGWGAITLTNDHVVRASRDGELMWLRADELLDTDRMVVSRGVSEQPMDVIDLSDYVSDLYLDGNMVSSKNSPAWINRFLPLDELTCYVLGLYCAEGSTDRTCGGQPNRAVWTMHEDESFQHGQVEKFSERLGVHFVKQQRKTSKAVNLRMASPVFARFVELVCGKFCNHKKVPEFIMAARAAQKLAFLRGYFAGDGTLGKIDQLRNASSGNAVKILQIHASTASRVLAQQVSTMLVSLGMKPGRTITKSRPHQRYPSYQTYLYSNDALSFLGRDNHPTAGKRPQYKEWSEEGQLRAIRSISHDRVENLPVYDFTVSEDHSFIAQGVVVHNCQGHALAGIFSTCFFLATGRKQAFSRAAAYYLSQRKDGIRGDQGSTLSGGQWVATENGLCLEKDWPYPKSYNPTEPSGVKYAYKLKTTRPMESMADINDWINSGLPIQIGIAWNNSCNQEVVSNYAASTNSGGHSTFFWLRAKSGNIRNINSWGKDWNGDGVHEWTEASIERALKHRFTVMIGYAPEAMSFPEQDPIGV